MTLKLRDSSFPPSPARRRSTMPTDLTEPIFEAALGLLRSELHGQRIRLVGVTASNFRDREQLGLFGRGRPEAAPGSRGGRRDPAQVRRAGGHPGRLVRAGVPAPFERDPNPRRAPAAARGAADGDAEEPREEPTRARSDRPRTVRA